MPKATSVARLILGSLSAAFLGLIVVATPAFSHAQLIAVSPQLGSSQPDSPLEVRLTFTEELMDFGYAMVLTDRSSGAEITTADPILAGPEIALPIDAQLPAGQYRAAWRVVSADGHPISGVVDFAVGEDFQDGAAQGAGQSAQASQNPGSAQGSDSAQDPGLASSATTGDTTSDAPWWRLPLIGIGGGAFALFVWYAVTQARRQ